ncbi:MAG TPA: phosphoribosyltransferase family protein [Pirellulales bacterium]|jgi:ComF family protein
MKAFSAGNIRRAASAGSRSIGLLAADFPRKMQIHSACVQEKYAGDMMGNLCDQTGSHYRNWVQRTTHGASGMKRVQWFYRSTGAVRAAWQTAAPKVGDSLARLVYPPTCSWCRGEIAEPQVDAEPQDDDTEPHDTTELRDNLGLCSVCSVLLAPPGMKWCLRCSAPLEGGAAVGSAADCSHCQGQKFPWQRAVALGPYHGELSRAIVKVKLPRHEPQTLSLAKLLFQKRETDLRGLAANFAVPVPMHWFRRWRRGVNGPDLIAEVLADKLNLPIRRLLKRRRLTPLQTDLSPSERQKNQKKSFVVRKRQAVQGQRILLVDDVLTTGATAAEAAKTLLAAGAAAVFVAAIARGIGEDAL